MSDYIKGRTGHEYPPNYAPPGKGTDLDEAWAVLDSVMPGVIPNHVRAFLAGQITGLLMRKRGEYGGGKDGSR